MNKNYASIGPFSGIKRGGSVFNMKRKIMISISLFFVFLLTGCIGEDYDFNPPNAFIESQLDFVKGELETANINWDSDKKYTKKTDDIDSLAKEQEPLHYYSGQKMDIRFDNGDIRINNINIYVKQDGEKTELPVDNQVFEMPKEEGNYLIVVKLEADSGNTEYVGNLDIRERDDNPYPPRVSLDNNSDEADKEELESYKAEWREYTVETDDMSFLKNGLEPLNHDSGEQMEISFDHHNFEIEDLRVYAHHNDEKMNLPVKDKFFNLPEEEGEYIIVVKLLTDKGSAEYAGNIIIK
ncbi:hypothetical protein [Sporosarcina sp. P16b]|uniref:hypothetical protein n=1 Tax=Sporosarcina sp. P16b TaxID=2048261 RepID=UPI001181B36E|nr:hypothetical protein [Sporosarcina sp. P16b]